MNFSFETVMSHRSKVDFMVRADDAGYDVTIYFVCTSDPDINIARVEQRVRSRGHDVPQDRIVARYWRALELLPAAVLVARRTVLFDNSAIVGYLANSFLPNPKTGLRPVGEEYVTEMITVYRWKRTFPHGYSITWCNRWARWRRGRRPQSR